MGFQTKAFESQDKLLDLLKADTALADWTIDYGLPSRRDELHIWVDEQVEDWSQDGDTSGLLSKNEGFSLTLYIYDRKTGADAKEIRDEIQAAAERVSAAIASAPFLGGTVMYATLRNLAYEGAFQDEQGQVREGVLKLTIGCTAFISGS